MRSIVVASCSKRKALTSGQPGVIRAEVSSEGGVVSETTECPRA